MEQSPTMTAPARPGVGWSGPQPWRWLIAAEILIVLGLSLGRSGYYAVLELVDALTRGPLRDQSTSLNPSVSPRPWFDLLYQLSGIVFTLVPVALVLFLLHITGSQALRALGLDLRRPIADLLWGLGLAAAIGIPGLGVYWLGRVLGATMEVVPAALDQHWWAVPVLVLQAVKNALIEEVVVAGYLVVRLEQIGWSPAAVLAVSALLRGSYHLYQGIGAGIANVVMGLVFAEFFRRTRRTGPLIVAHTVMDVVVFVGYALLGPALGL